MHPFLAQSSRQRTVAASVEGGGGRGGGGKIGMCEAAAYFNNRTGSTW